VITLDLKKMYKDLYLPSAKAVQEVRVPCFNFIRIDGVIEDGMRPGDSPSFANATEAMYGAAYTLKFASKQRKQDPIDFPVMALEGLWWVETGMYDFNNASGWLYTLMIMQPEHITPAMFADALDKLRKKRPNPAIDQLRLEPFEEGRAIQVMHIGPYAAEPATLQRMDDYAAQHGLSMHGKHHEIYLSDPRRAQPEKMKTVLRHPVR
jgi:hypothetical protein